MPGGQINDPKSGEKLFSSSSFQHSLVSPSDSSFELTRHPSRALDLRRALLSELQRYNSETVRCGELGAKVPGHCQEQLPQTLIVRLLNTHVFLLFLKFEGAPLTQPPCLRVTYLIASIIASPMLTQLEAC